MRNVQNSWGSEIHASLDVPENAMYIRKGEDPEVDSYSAFRDNSGSAQTQLASLLQKEGVKELAVCGLALDVCVAATAADGVESGFRVLVVEDASAAFDDVAAEEARRDLQRKGCAFTLAKDLPQFLDDKNTHPHWLYPDQIQ